MITQERANSRNSGKIRSIIQKICLGPEILDHIFRSYKDAVDAPELLGRVFQIVTKNSAPFRYRGKHILDDNARTCKFQNTSLLNSS
jgi:hypothetical protein